MPTPVASGLRAAQRKLRAAILGTSGTSKSMEDINAIVLTMRSRPLADVEKELKVTSNKDHRARLGYSGSQYYRTLSPGDRSRRQKRVARFLAKYAESRR
jgi:hypothetical protein